mmetsp:Transcript_15735/g.34036  ORF Transcript_15735/g.34036 Transcript_15735/m.34036 type:complete len:301 (+) Transcript_15735:135-1037(+)
MRSSIRSISVLLVVAPQLLGSHAFHTIGPSPVCLPASRNEAQLGCVATSTRTRTRIAERSRFNANANANSRTSKIVLRESSSVGENEAGDGDERAAPKASSSSSSSKPTPGGKSAATNTINERLMAELREAEETERFGTRGGGRNAMGPVDGYGRSRKTDAEVQAAIAEARDLNGVNPIVAIAGSFFAFGVAGALWIATNQLGTYFALNQPETEVYFVLRTAQVFRNVVMGMISLASGFFGVTGLGIFGMGVRVAYGVMTGELDPTPIKTKSASSKETVNLGNMMDLMMNKKPGRRGGKK